MYKSTLLVVLFTCAGLYVRPQEVKGHPIQAPNVAYMFGVKGGVSYSDMNLQLKARNDYVSYPSRTGIQLGLVYHKPLSAHWALQPELVYASQGYKMQYRDSWNMEYHENIGHGYFNLPLLVQHVSPSGFILYTGPQPGLLAFNRRDEFQVFDLAWVGGTGYLSRKGWGVDVRYNAGLLNIASNQYDYLPFAKARNRVVQAGIVYLFAPALKR